MLLPHGYEGQSGALQCSTRTILATLCRAQRSGVCLPRRSGLPHATSTGTAPVAQTFDRYVAQVAAA